MCSSAGRPRSPPCPHFCRELRSGFTRKVQEFIGALADAHRTAHSERSDTREELESLLALMSRLDFNGWVACWLAGWDFLDGSLRRGQAATEALGCWGQAAAGASPACLKGDALLTYCSLSAS